MGRSQLAGPSSPKSNYSVRMLAAYLDISGRLRMEGDTIDANAEMKGLRLETEINLDGSSPTAISDVRGIAGST